MIKGLPTITIVCIVSFLLIGADLLIRANTDDPAPVARIAAPVGDTAERATARDETVELAEPTPETEFDDEFYDEPDFGMSSDGLMESADPLVGTAPMIEPPASVEPFRDDAFGNDFGQPLPPDPAFGDNVEPPAI